MLKLPDVFQNQITQIESILREIEDINLDFQNIILDMNNQSFNPEELKPRFLIIKSLESKYENSLDDFQTLLEESKKKLIHLRENPLYLNLYKRNLILLKRIILKLRSL